MKNKALVISAAFIALILIGGLSYKVIDLTSIQYQNDQMILKNTLGKGIYHYILLGENYLEAEPHERFDILYDLSNNLYGAYSIASALISKDESIEMFYYALITHTDQLTRLNQTPQANSEDLMKSNGELKQILIGLKQFRSNYENQNYEQLKNDQLIEAWHNFISKLFGQYHDNSILIEYQKWYPQISNRL
ncbi:hypothetical protein M6D81_31465 [Paenibacillus sp. J5C_2022]|uniref:hypothetical protein n=1 Tax=Paenibacillus sp. J5C2022 TaxID=2977129 RepID=UPI0021D163CB|nr:hypothetical protein [Paenibacillus sp. J5C2022]MCU6713226.1 hypothetical protein [Paenibacillus sp. J5C2022]